MCEDKRQLPPALVGGNLGLEELQSDRDTFAKAQ